MKLPRNAALTASMLAASMLLNVTLVSCGNEPTAPPSENPEIIAKLVEVTERLAAIEAKLDAQALASAARLDSLEVAVTTVASGVVPLGGIDSARVDSILALASFLAVDATTASWEACGKLEFELGAKVGIKAEGHGEGKASVGAWAGTGAFAGLVIGIKNHVEGEVGLALPFEFGVCLPTGGEAPPVRGGAAPGSARFADASITSSMNSVISQLGLTEEKVETAIGGLSAIVSNGSFPSTQSLASALPLPASFSGKFSDPLGSLQAPAAARMNEAITALCSGSYGPVVSGPISTGCGYMSGGAPNIGGLFTMMQQFPAMQTTLTTVSGVIDGVCTRLNTVGNRSLTIPNPLEIGPTNLYGPTRLFPSYVSVSC